MGYESKLYICDRMQITGTSTDGDKYNYVSGLVIASFDLCKMDYRYNFPEIFTTPIDFPLMWERDENGKEQEIYNDCYDARCEYTDITTVLNKLKEIQNSSEPYRRIPPCIALLEGFQKTEQDGMWGNPSQLIVVHYGH